MTFIYYFNPMQHGGVVYILTNQHHTVLYTGATSDLPPRMIQHREKHFPSSFTARYNVTKLVYFEVHPSIEEAIVREKYIKGKVRRWKRDLIDSLNPDWIDLYDTISDW